ncbi:MAG: hypothetical protein RLZZ15_1735 [Verrucomicrobiota bacterium]|jgi:PAS domain S-box-containing protein
MPHSFPLRLKVPLGFLALGVALMAFAYAVRRIEINQRNEELMRQRANGLGQFIAPELETALARGDDAAAGPLLARLRTIPHLSLALLCDDEGRILHAYPSTLAGRRVGDARPGAASILAQARAARAAALEVSPDGNTQWAAFPLARARDVPGGARPGWFVTASDIAAQKAPAVAAQLRGTAVVMGLILLGCAGLWWYFNRMVIRRLTALVDHTRRLATDARPSAALTAGDDELAHLGGAIQRMAADLRAQAEAMRTTEAQRSAIVEHASDCIIVIDHAGRIADFNAAAERTLGHARAAVIARPFADVVIAPAHREAQARALAPLLGADRSLGIDGRLELVARRADGTEFPAELALTGLPGARARFAGFLRDVGARKQHERWLAAELDLLAEVAAGPQLATALEAVCRFAETQSPGLLCSILLLDAEGRRLRHGAAPSLPPAYCAAIDGVEIGPVVGSCGTAAFRQERVVVADIATDPLWVPFRELALAHGLRACWSTPITGGDDRVLGTFAIYYREPRQPAAEHEQIVRMATHAASLALQRERAAARLRASEERFALAFRASPVAIFISRLKDGRLVDVNQAFLDTLGFQDRAEVVGRTSLELGLWADPADRARVLERLAARGSLRDVECAFVRRPGERREGLASAEMLELEGEPLMLGLMFDVTDRKRADDRLRQSEREQERQRALLEATLDGLREGVVVCDMAGEVFYWNRSALAIHGYGSVDEGRRRLPEFAQRYEFLEESGGILPFEQWPLVRALRGETVRDWEGRLHDKVAGWERWFTFSGSLARDATGRPILGVLTMTEITERRKLEEQLRQSQKMDAIGQLAGGIAHDFNNILTVIIAQAGLGALQPGLPPATTEAFREIRRAGDRAASLTRQLLAFGRRQVLQRRHLDLNTLVTTDARMLRRLLGEHVALELALHHGPLPLHADAGMITQILLNLAINARDAMPEGGRLVIATAACEIAADGPGAPPGAAPGRYALLRVQDTGHGIPADILPRIFEPFYTTKPLGKGTGLGLATVFGIVQQHLGWVLAASPPGAGATLSVYLPLTDPPASTPQLSPAPPTRPGSETILVTEDEPTVRNTLRILLEQQGYRVLTAEDGPHALAVWSRHRPEIALLLTDLVMPGGLSGQDLAARLQAESPPLAVVFMTGYSEEIAGRGLTLGPRQAFLQKPFLSEELFKQLRRALDAR